MIPHSLLFFKKWSGNSLLIKCSILKTPKIDKNVSLNLELTHSFLELLQAMKWKLSPGLRITFGRAFMGWSWQPYFPNLQIDWKLGLNLILERKFERMGWFRMGSFKPSKKVMFMINTFYRLSFCATIEEVGDQGIDRVKSFRLCAAMPLLEDPIFWQDSNFGFSPYTQCASFYKNRGIIYA